MNKIGLFQIIDLDQSKWRGYSRCHIFFGTEWTSKFIKDFLFLSVVMSEAFDVFDAAFTRKDLGHRFAISFMLDFQFSNSGSCTRFEDFQCVFP